MMAYTGGEALVEVFRSHDVKAIFCSPGTEWAPVWEALAKLRAKGKEEPAYFNCRHEMLAASAAIGYAVREGGLPAILLHTAGGLLHCAMAVHGAYMDRVPLLVLAGESARFTEGTDPERGRGWQWLHLSDVGGPSRMAAPFVKWAQAVTSRETLASAVARACLMARMAPQGPVCLSVSKEYLQEELEESLTQFPLPQSYSPPHPAEVEKVASLLLASKKPIVITERLGDQPEAVPKLVELAESLGLPVFESMTAEVVNFPKEHPLHAGFDVTEPIRKADLVLVLAALHPWNPQRTGPQPGAKVIFLDDQAPYQQFPFWNYQADMILSDDVALALEALVRQVKSIKASPSPASERVSYWQGVHDQALHSWDREARESASKKPIDSHWLCYAINEWLPPEAIVVLETITHTTVAGRLIRRIKPGNLFKGNYRGLGSGMGVARGVKLAAKGRPVVHLVGDGCFNYAPVLAALGFSQEYQLPVLTVVFNNGAYRAMQNAHLSIYPEGWASRTQRFYGVDISPNPDYAQLMKVFDGYGEKVEDPQEVIPALGRAWAEIQKGRSALLDIILEPGDPGDSR